MFIKKYFALLFCILLISGCGKKPKQDINSVLEKVNSSLAAGSTNIALNILSEAMNDAEYKPFRAQLFTKTLEIMLAGNRADEATATYMATLGKDIELARAGFNSLSRYYQEPGRTAACDAWTKIMMNAPLPKDLLEQVFMWKINIAMAKGENNTVIALIPEIMEKFPPDTSQRILQHMVTTPISAQKYDQAHAVIDAVENKCSGEIPLKHFLLSQRTQLHFTQERWQDGENSFKNSAAALPDPQLRTCLQQILSSCTQKSQLDLADKLCEFVLDNQKSKTTSTLEAASQWMENTKKRKDISLIPVRLESLKSKEVSNELLLEFLDEYFYTIIGSGTKEQVKAMNAFAGKLLPGVKNDEQYGKIQTLILDGTFVQDDFEGVVKLLETGIKGKPQIWLDMLSNKAKAHMMLRDGKSKEAVQYFRRFMENLAKWGQIERDPCSPMVYYPEMCLGMNARRIGDILGKIGETKDSEDAYKEARNYFKMSKTNLTENSLEMDFVNKQLDTIPGK